MARTPFGRDSRSNMPNSFPVYRTFSDSMDFPASENITVSDFAWSPRISMGNLNVDWKETSDAYLFTADLPGVKKEDVKVDLVDELPLDGLVGAYTLRICGEWVKVKEETENSDVWHRMERSSGSFMRRFWLPDSINVDNISARLKNGLLRVNVPKIKTGPSNASDVKNIEIN